MRRLLDVLLTSDLAQRMRLVHAGLGLLALSVGALALLLLAAAGLAPRRAALAWALLVPAAQAAQFMAVRSGWSRRLDDPSMSLVQLLTAGAGCALAYAIVREGQSLFLLVFAVAVMASVLSATPRQLRWAGAFTVVAIAGAMAWRGMRDSGRVWPELLQLVLLLTLLPAAAVLAGRVTALRQHQRLQQQHLETALARIRELITHDELTGVLNRRHLRELMQQEHQRCVRSGRGFCLAVLDLDRFKDVNDRHGRAAGDAALRSIAHEAMRRVRASDALARWSGDRFVLLMTDTRSELAKAGAERIRSGMAQLPIAIAGGEFSVSLSAGLAEHRSAETVEQTLDRAQRALADAKDQGRNRLVVAG